PACVSQFRGMEGGRPPWRGPDNSDPGAAGRRVWGPRPNQSRPLQAVVGYGPGRGGEGVGVAGGGPGPAVGKGRGGAAPRPARTAKWRRERSKGEGGRASWLGQDIEARPV